MGCCTVGGLLDVVIFKQWLTNRPGCISTQNRSIVLGRRAEKQVSAPFRYDTAELAWMLPLCMYSVLGLVLYENENERDLHVRRLNALPCKFLQFTVCVAFPLPAFTICGQGT